MKGATLSFQMVQTPKLTLLAGLTYSTGNQGPTMFVMLNNVLKQTSQNRNIKRHLPKRMTAENRIGAVVVAAKALLV